MDSENTTQVQTLQPDGQAEPLNELKKNNEIPQGFNRSSGDNMVTAVLEIKGIKRHVDRICSFLRTVEYLGNIGASRETVFYVDGDGDCRLKFKHTDGFFDKIPDHEHLRYRPSIKVNKYISMDDDDPTLS